MILMVHNVKLFVLKLYVYKYKLKNKMKFKFLFLKGMIALRRNGVEVQHEDFMDAILEVQAKKKMNLNYYA
jgi:hypothetical protein